MSTGVEQNLFTNDLFAKNVDSNEYDSDREHLDNVHYLGGLRDRSGGRLEVLVQLVDHLVKRKKFS